MNILKSDHFLFEGLSFINHVTFSFDKADFEESIYHNSLLDYFLNQDIISDWNTYGYIHGEKWKSKNKELLLKYQKGPIKVNRLEKHHYEAVDNFTTLENKFRLILSTEHPLYDCYWAFAKCFLKMRDIFITNTDSIKCIYYLDSSKLPPNILTDDNYNYYYEVISIDIQISKIHHFSIGSN